MAADICSAGIKQLWDGCLNMKETSITHLNKHTFDGPEFLGAHGKNPQCTPGIPPVFAMHSRKFILSQRYAYLRWVILDADHRKWRVFLETLHFHI